MIKVQYFASVRERLGMESESIEASSDSPLTVDELIARLADRHGEKWQGVLREGALLVAVNHTMAKRSSAVRAGDEVAFFPPVTGG